MTYTHGTQKNKVIYLNDMSKCIPKTALSNKKEKSCWQLIEYEAENTKGVMACAVPEANAPDITYPLNLRGWYAIYLGIWGGMWDSTQYCALKVKLKHDPCFTFFVRERENYFCIDKRFWKYADLTDQNIVFGQQNTGFKKGAFVAYVRLEELSEREIQVIEQDRDRKDTKRLIAMNDAFNFFFERRPTTKQQIWEQIEPLRDTDFQAIYWCTGPGGDVCSYPTKVGTVIGNNSEIFPRIGDRHIAESMQVFSKEKINPLKVALEYAHQIGLEFHVYQRMGAFAFSPPFEDFFTSPFYQEHPELHCIDKDGRKITRMSYAFPEVRNWLLFILREVAEYGIDGIDLCFVRGAPFLLYEEPLIRGFKQKYGTDPRELEDRNEKWLYYRAQYMTNFVRTVRREIDKISKQSHRNRLRLSTHVLHNESENLFYGLDLSAWVKENLIDRLIPYPWQGNEVDIDYFVQLVQGTNCKLYPDILPGRIPIENYRRRSISPEEYRRRALKLYEKGVDGLCFWDTSVRYPLKAQWSMLRRLGHRKELNKWTDGKSVYFQEHKLERIGGYNVSRYPPQWCY